MGQICGRPFDTKACILKSPLNAFCDTENAVTLLYFMYTEVVLQLLLHYKENKTIFAIIKAYIYFLFVCDLKLGYVLSAKTLQNWNIYNK